MAGLCMDFEWKASLLDDEICNLKIEPILDFQRVAAKKRLLPLRLALGE